MTRSCRQRDRRRLTLRQLVGQFQLGESRTLLHLGYATRAVEVPPVDCREGRVEEREPACDWRECYECYEGDATASATASAMASATEGEKKSHIVVGAVRRVQHRASYRGRRTWS